MKPQPARLCLAVVLVVVAVLTVIRMGLAIHTCRQGWKAIEDGKAEDAVSNFRKVLELEPGLPSPHIGLALALSGLGKTHAAMAEFARAYECSTRRTEAKFSVPNESFVRSGPWNMVIEVSESDVGVRVLSYGCCIVVPCGQQEAVRYRSCIRFFSNWRGPNTISMRDLSHVAAPLGLQGFRGDFSFSQISGKSRGAIRVFPIGKGDGEVSVVQFGYTLQARHFVPRLRPDDEITFVLYVRISNSTRRGAELFIQDKTRTWERNHITMEGTGWERYSVSKTIRKGASLVLLGIHWTPEAENTWLEVKDARLFVNCPGTEHF